ncbi:unnamed protein product [Rhizoctonia solani]|uniref:Uncharacterized protein n=1 Tax=Rhizoctonia solani TaxID=456999 RepID=A0A8H3BTG9_9AGAM|nr:unnamed protein product [Rhizoctonia solani]
MGEYSKRKRSSRNNVKKARRKLAEGMVAQNVKGGKNGYSSAGMIQTGELVSSDTVVENTELEHLLAPDPSLQSDSVITGPLGHEPNEHPKQAAHSTPGASENGAVDVGHMGNAPNNPDDVELSLDGTQGGQQHQEGTGDNGPLVEEDSGSESSEYEIKVDTHLISVVEAKQLVTAIEQAQAAAEAACQYNREAKRPVIDELTKRRILLMTSSLNLCCYLGCGMTKALLTAAASLGLGPWAARMARKWIRQFQATGELPENLYGKWNSSIIKDEDFSQMIQEHLRSKGQYAQAHDIREFFQTEEAQPF